MFVTLQFQVLVRSVLEHIIGHNCGGHGVVVVVVDEIEADEKEEETGVGDGGEYYQSHNFGTSFVCVRHEFACSLTRLFNAYSAFSHSIEQSSISNDLFINLHLWLHMFFCECR
jgi:hypothetical protein